jgi:hypothetical protein
MIVIERGVGIPTRDGTILSADVYRGSVDIAVPVFLQRTPYDRTSAVPRRDTLDPVQAVEAGYAVVIQDVRGRYGSQGTFEPFRHERTDGADTIDWLVRQPWCDGRVCMYGRSYVGATQLLAATSAPAGLVACAPDRTSADPWDGWIYQGGVLQHGFIGTWLLSALGGDELARLRVREPERASQLASMFDRLADSPHAALSVEPAQLAELVSEFAPYVSDWLQHRSRDGYWAELSAVDRLASSSASCLHVGGWFDIFLNGTIRSFQTLRAISATEEGREFQQLIIGPWTHQTSGDAAGDVFYGKAANLGTLDATTLHLDFFRACLDRHQLPGARVRYFLLGANVWHEADDWPPSGARAVTWHLGPDSTLTPNAPFKSGQGNFVHDPANPVPTVAGATILPGDDVSFVAGQRYRARAQVHPGTAVWTTKVLEGPIELCGPIEARISASAEAPDADFYACLSLVGADGRALHLTDGIRRMSDAVPHRSEEIVEFGINLGHIAARVEPGMSIRLELAGSCFPRFEQHPDHRRPVRQATHFGPQHPSTLTITTR